MRLVKNDCIFLSLIVLSLLCEKAFSSSRIFPVNSPERQWVEFEADGYKDTVNGTIFTAEAPPTCGVSLGGISTGCLDVEAGGVFGFNSIFIPLPHRPQLLTPFLGLSVNGQTYVLADEKYIRGGTVQGNCDPRSEVDPKEWMAELIEIKGVKPANKIHYWGHFPVADMEYETDCPVSVGLRAWSPFIPGDTFDSDIPAAVFEIHLRNTSQKGQSGSVAFNFPGPTHSGTHPDWAVLNQDKDIKPIVWPNFEGLRGRCSPGWPELEESEFTRSTINNKKYTGLAVETKKGFGYVVGVSGCKDNIRFGGSLSEDNLAWSQISKKLPQPKVASNKDAGQEYYGHAGASVAIDFDLKAGQSEKVNVILAWYSPKWTGKPGNVYTRAYTKRYNNAVEVANHIVKDQKSLLKRVLAWQQVIYGEKDIPGWLQDALINSLYLIPETSLWATSASGPIADWCDDYGLFGMIESPRGCPQTECLPCTWYGTLPVLFFFPDLMEANLNGHLHYQRQDGAAAFNWGWIADMSKPTDYAWQVSLNGFCFCDLMYRYWQRQGLDKKILNKLYPAVKKSTIYSMSLRSGDDHVISMPEGDKGEEWWEHSGWYGMVAHAGGVRMAQLRIAEHMAQTAGDEEFVLQCQKWLKMGQASMENKMWNETTQSYLLSSDPDSDKKSEDIMANQFDGNWVTDLHGLKHVFREDRFKTALETIKKTCLVDSIGAVSFASPDGSPQMASYGIFVPEIYMLAMTYLYAGQQETGLEIIKKCVDNSFLRQGIGWDQTNMLYAAGDGGRTVGSDYYQNTIIWAMPAAIKNQTLQETYKKGGLVDRIIKAGK